MPQYDLLLTQNVHASLTEFSEKTVNISKGGLLSALTDKTPAVLAPGINGYMLVRDDAEVTGLKWIDKATLSHTQNTDTGTTGTTFAIDSDGFNLPITAESAAKLGIKVAGGASYADLQAKDATFNIVTVGSASPSGAYELCHKTYVDGLLAANDAMIFKGTVGTGGTHTIAAFNALATYNAGWSYKILEAGTIKGKTIETADIGGLIVTTADRAGSGNLDADFIVLPSNMDGIVVGPASTTDNYVALFSGTTGKILKAGSGALGTAAYSATGDYATAAQGTLANNAIPKGTFTATGNEVIVGSAASTFAPVTLAASTILGRKATGNVVALTAAELSTILGLGSMAAETALNYVTKALFDANSILFATADNTPSPLTVAASTFVGRKATGDISALSSSESLAMLWASSVAIGSAPATKATAGVQGNIAFDANFMYICTATNTWKRFPIATNW